MMAKFAKALASNIRTIVEATTHIQAIDFGQWPNGKPNEVMIARTELVKEVERAEARIASILQQPGTWKEDK